MNECVFCKIGNKEVSAHIVYEDERVVAFLDKHPINMGHVLVVPKKHEPDFYELDNDTYNHLMSVVKKLSPGIARVTNPKKMGMVIAGFDVPHTHVHLIPMHAYHDITSKSLLEGNRANPSDEDLGNVAAELRGFLHG